MPGRADCQMVVKRLKVTQTRPGVSQVQSWVVITWCILHNSCVYHLQWCLLFIEYYFHRDFWIYSISSRFSFFWKESFCYPDLSGFSPNLSWKGKQWFLEELLEVPACFGLSSSFNSFFCELCLCWMLLEKALLNGTGACSVTLQVTVQHINNSPFGL